ncbi:ATP-binding cassette domain-containing protein [Microvirga pudoricolor]|uniref:ATP-binding cassette domain-containing protein n=1 Tax=Microvirga pudoricolor TaxID=2778729 RepID=UPI0019516BB1|nr:ABC transporter ATP-binding protein [Microvirga pudoricolor]MBM6592841.1 ATP-binding cassette domain-containing protein [Microvirga pudoricolor]
MHPHRPALEARGVAVRLPGGARDAVRDIALSVDPGSTLALLGPSGSGKSTLALALAGAIPTLVPAALTGSIRRPEPEDGFATTILQDTDAHLVALSVEDEIAFALENRGLAPEEIDRRIDAALTLPPARGLGRRDRTLSLSGGWRQRLAIGAALAEGSALLIADEPFAHLDPEAASAAAEALARLRRSSGACVLVEHRADTAMRLADAVLVLGPNGHPYAHGPTGPTLRAIARSKDAPRIRLPAPVRAGAALEQAGLLPAGWHGRSTEDLISALGPSASDPLVAGIVVEALGLRCRSAPAAAGSPLATLDNAFVRRGGRGVLAGIDLEIRPGEVVGLAGPNGAGKTSLALALAGALRIHRGRAIRERIAAPVYLPQNPSLALTSGTLEGEASRRRLGWTDAARAVAGAGLDPDPHRNSLAFSHGERRRLAMALAMAAPGPRLVILDEPTSGLDEAGMAGLAADIATLRGRGSGVLIVGHDLDWLATVADRILVLDGGRIVAEGPSLAILARALAGSLPVCPSDGSRLAYRLGWVPGAAGPC